MCPIITWFIWFVIARLEPKIDRVIAFLVNFLGPLHWKEITTSYTMNQAWSGEGAENT